MSNKKVPDRWLDYTPIGRVIEGSNFVAFKVPLHEVIKVENSSRIDSGDKR